MKTNLIGFVATLVLLVGAPLGIVAWGSHAGQASMPSGAPTNNTNVATNPIRFVFITFLLPVSPKPSAVAGG